MTVDFAGEGESFVATGAVGSVSVSSADSCPSRRLGYVSVSPADAGELLDDDDEDAAAVAGRGEGVTAVGSRPASAEASVDSMTRWARTPRPTITPHKKITTATTVEAMKRKTSCLPFS